MIQTGPEDGDLDRSLETEIATAIQTQIQEAILNLLQRRGAGKTICPSEAARQVAPEGWESLMEPTRQVAKRLAAAGEITITQGGVEVDGSRAKGAIRLRRK
jgi:hypothetical protein